MITRRAAAESLTSGEHDFAERRDVLAIGALLTIRKDHLSEKLLFVPSASSHAEDAGHGNVGTLEWLAIFLETVPGHLHVFRWPPCFWPDHAAKNFDKRGGKRFFSYVSARLAFF